jgi:type II secretory pathway pseudopilin PulG
MIVVIGIIVVLASIALPMVLRAYRQADRTRAAADLATISTALEAYKQDFGDYPRPTANATAHFVLGQALLGAGPSMVSSLPDFSTSASTGDLVKSTTTAYVCTTDNTTAAPPGTNWLTWTAASTAYPAPPLDGADGYGFRTRIATANAGASRVYGPYVDPDKLNHRGVCLLDREGSPILYYPANLARPNIRAGGNYVNTTGTALYNASNCPTNLMSLNGLQRLLGDLSVNGQIDANETPLSEGAYLLISAGPDRTFGPASGSAADIRNCDDITNFTR